jgi:hypothetical protein
MAAKPEKQKSPIKGSGFDVWAMLLKEANVRGSFRFSRGDCALA